jgi:hypothetical protein
MKTRLGPKLVRATSMNKNCPSVGNTILVCGSVGRNLKPLIIRYCH